MRIVVWGVKGARNIHEALGQYTVAYIDSFKDSDSLNGMNVFLPSEFGQVDYDFIFVCSSKTDAIIEQCIRNDIKLNKIVFLDSSLKKLNEQFYAWIEKNVPELYELMKKRRVFSARCCSFDVYDKGHVFGPEYDIDYFRYRTFEMISDKVLNNTIKGDVAELGCFRGFFASLINKKFNNKKLYLFDSFEGFIESEARAELANGHITEEFIERYKNTSEDYVLSQMQFKDNVVIRKGFFPNTAIGLDDVRLCFASIDFDLEESIYEGIKWVWPRLSEGGYIMLHDYWGNEHVRNAVSRYEEEIEDFLHMVPIADREGTLVIVK